MSYCVNCGVELEKSQGKCPLCDTVVQNPMEPYNPRVKKPYPARTAEQNLSINRKYYLLLLSIAFLVPALICFLLDFIGGDGLNWSLYAIGAILMLFVFFLVPGIITKYKLYASIIADGVAICAYLELIEYLSGTGAWFSKIVFPVMILAILMTLAMVASVRQKLLTGLTIPAVMFVLIGILSVATELLIVSNVEKLLHLSWSPVVLVPCFLVALALFLVHMNGPLRSELHRRLHI
jgi:hypothetical protein